MVSISSLRKFRDLNLNRSCMIKGSESDRMLNLRNISRCRGLLGGLLLGGLIVCLNSDSLLQHEYISCMKNLRILSDILIDTQLCTYWHLSSPFNNIVHFSSSDFLDFRFRNNLQKKSNLK